MKVGVIGFGVSGKALAEFLIESAEAESVTVFELKTNVCPPPLKNTKFVLGYTEKDLLNSGVDYFVLSSSVKHDTFERLNLPYISEIDFVCERLKPDAKFAFITGTKGKGTVSCFVNFILSNLGFSTFVGGNIGTPVVHALRKNYDFYIFETSSFQLRSTKKAKPDVSALINIYPEHLDWHESYQDYKYSKFNVFSNAYSCVLPNSIDVVYDFLKQNKRFANTYYVCVNKIEESSFLLMFLEGAGGIANDGKNIFIKSGSFIDTATFDFETFGKLFLGKHNIVNLLFSVIISFLLLERSGRIFRISHILNFSPSDLPHLPFRLEYEGEIGGIKIYNDSKSTTVASLEAALLSFQDNSILLICGGRTKGYDFEGIKDIIKDKVKKSFIIGEAKHILAKSFHNYEFCEDIKDALSKALKSSQKGDVILFSPGCASFDMFNSAEHRGEVFRKEVEKLKF